MKSFNLEGESYLLDVAAGIQKGLKSKDYKIEGAVFMVREAAIQMHIYDAEKDRTYTIVIKEVVKSETGTEINVKK